MSAELQPSGDKRFKNLRTAALGAVADAVVEARLLTHDVGDLKSTALPTLLTGSYLLYDGLRQPRHTEQSGPNPIFEPSEGILDVPAAREFEQERLEEAMEEDKKVSRSALLKYGTGAVVIGASALLSNKLSLDQLAVLGAALPTAAVVFARSRIGRRGRGHGRHSQ